MLRSVARNTATLVDISKLEGDIREKDSNGISRPTVYDRQSISAHRYDELQFLFQ